jgi:hypothetical protein
MLVDTKRNCGKKFMDVWGSFALNHVSFKGLCHYVNLDFVFTEYKEE